MMHVSELFVVPDRLDEVEKKFFEASARPFGVFEGETVWMVTFLDEVLLTSDFPFEDACVELATRGFWGSLRMELEGFAGRQIQEASIHPQACWRLETYAARGLSHSRAWRLRRQERGLYDLGVPWPKVFFEPRTFRKNELRRKYVKLNAAGEETSVWEYGPHLAAG